VAAARVADRHPPSRMPSAPQAAPAASLTAGPGRPATTRDNGGLRPPPHARPPSPTSATTPSLLQRDLGGEV